MCMFDKKSRNQWSIGNNFFSLHVADLNYRRFGATISPLKHKSQWNKCLKKYVWFQFQLIFSVILFWPRKQLKCKQIRSSDPELKNINRKGQLGACCRALEFWEFRKAYGMNHSLRFSELSKLYRSTAGTGLVF